MRDTAKTEEAALELANLIEKHLDMMSESDRLECLAFLQIFVDTMRNKPN